MTVVNRAEGNLVVGQTLDNVNAEDDRLMEIFQSVKFACESSNAMLVYKTSTEECFKPLAHEKKLLVCAVQRQIFVFQGLLARFKLSSCQGSRRLCFKHRRKSR